MVSMFILLLEYTYIFYITSTPGNRTLQYYAMNALTVLRKLHLSKEWKTFKPKEQTLEKWLAFIVQWCTPNVDMHWEKIATTFDGIAAQVTLEILFNFKILIITCRR